MVDKLAAGFSTTSVLAAFAVPLLGGCMLRVVLLATDAPTASASFASWWAVRRISSSSAYEMRRRGGATPGRTPTSVNHSPTAQ